MRWSSKRQRGWLVLAAAASLACYASPASATLIVRDTFNYDVGSNLGNANLNGGEGSWAGTQSWQTSTVPGSSTMNQPGQVADPSQAKIVDVSSNPLAVPGTNGGNRAVEIGGSGSLDGLNNQPNFLFRNLNETRSDSTVYVSFLFRFAGQPNSSTEWDNNEFFSLWFSRNTTPTTTSEHTSEPNIGIKGQSNGGGPGNGGTNDIQARVRLDREAYADPSDIAQGSTYYIVGKLSKVNSANYNRFDLWVNPTYYQVATGAGAATSTGTGTLSSFNTLGFRVANLQTNNIPFQFDQVTLGTAISDVVTSPEPGGIALLASAAPIALFLGYRRRKRAIAA